MQDTKHEGAVADGMRLCARSSTATIARHLMHESWLLWCCGRMRSGKQSTCVDVVQSALMLLLDGTCCHQG